MRVHNEHGSAAESYIFRLVSLLFWMYFSKWRTYSTLSKQSVRPKVKHTDAYKRADRKSRTVEWHKTKRLFQIKSCLSEGLASIFPGSNSGSNQGSNSGSNSGSHSGSPRIKLCFKLSMKLRIKLMIKTQSNSGSNSGLNPDQTQDQTLDQSQDQTQDQFLTSLYLSINERASWPSMMFLPNFLPFIFSTLVKHFKSFRI